jgi:hypothetical protein
LGFGLRIEENGSAYTDQLQSPRMTATTGIGGQALGWGWDGDNLSPPTPNWRHSPRVTSSEATLADRSLNARRMIGMSRGQDRHGAKGTAHRAWYMGYGAEGMR